MTLPRFQIDADVFTSNSRGKVVEWRDAPKARRIYGVADVNGGVTYHLEESLRPA